MSRSLELWQSVGGFFGISKTDSENLQRWKKTTEKKIKDGDFGLHFARRDSRKSRESQILDQADKVLSRISASQDCEERDEAEQSQEATVSTGRLPNQQEPSTSMETVASARSEKHSLLNMLLRKKYKSDKGLQSTKSSESTSSTGPSTTEYGPSTSQAADQTSLEHRHRQVSINRLHEPGEDTCIDEVDVDNIQQSKAASLSQVNQTASLGTNLPQVSITTSHEKPKVNKEMTQETYPLKTNNTESSTSGYGPSTSQSTDQKSLQHRARQVSINKLYEPEEDTCIDEVAVDSIEQTTAVSLSNINKISSKEKSLPKISITTSQEKLVPKVNKAASKETYPLIKITTGTSSGKNVPFTDLNGVADSGTEIDEVIPDSKDSTSSVKSASVTAEVKKEPKAKLIFFNELLGKNDALPSSGVELESIVMEDKSDEIVTTPDAGEPKAEAIEVDETKAELDQSGKDLLSKKPEELSEDDLVYGKDAFTHYNFYVNIEKKGKQLELKQQLSQRLQEYDWKIQAIDDLIQLAKAYYTNTESTTAAEWKELKRRVKRSSSRKITRTEVRHKLDTLPEFRPFFTYGIIALAKGYKRYTNKQVQLLVFIVVLYLGGLTYIGVEPRLTLQTGIKTFLGLETIHRWTPPNIWIGPEQGHLIRFGALFAPCMREDIDIQLSFAKLNYSYHSQLGCCEVAFRNTAGTTTEAECDAMTDGVGVWKSGVTCSQRATEDMGVAHILKPCCVDLTGHCELVTFKHCTFLHGQFHISGPEHCTQVNCMSEICHLGSLKSKPDQPWLLDSPNQWWRLLISLFYHHGIIHITVCVAAEWLLFRQVEQTAGWLRVVIIYVLAGMAGLLTGALFSPHQPHMGSDGAIFGMVGVVIIELVQYWSMVHRPWMEVAKIGSALVIFLLCGTLPYLDIFSLLLALIVGMLLAVILLPYITFGRWQARVRLILLLTMLPLLFLVMFVLFYAFYKVQTFESCEICNFSFLSDFLVWMLLSVILLPYITFERWQARVRSILLTMLPLLVLVMSAPFYAFYKVQTFENCETC